MVKASWLVSVGICATLLQINVPPSIAQTVLPYAPALDSEELEQEGIRLVEDAIQLSTLQQYDIALPYAKLATQLAPEMYQSWFVLGTIYSETDRVQEAIPILEKARKMKPNQGGIFFSLGSAYFKLGQYQKSVNEINLGLKLEPDSANAWFDLGNNYLMLKNYTEAVTAYRTALKHDSAFWPATNNIGLVRYEQGNAPEAISQWEMAITQIGQSAEPQLAIAVANYTEALRLEQQGQTTTARIQKKNALIQGQSAIALDSRYGELDYLRKNLWGEQLLIDSQAFLNDKEIQEFLKQIKDGFNDISL
ncbi:MAG: tetratricopeptide repeat protein [Synechococcaceae cyanobacterium RL_1_2]|nr:tetratricopeptide repeat protein [Synechococcaceae cyanobacterium RL_1_2]